MAFTILNEEEIQLLNEHQRIQYQTELDIYQRRIAFVEQLEAYDHMEIKPYEPKLNGIMPIKSMDVTHYDQPIHKKPSFVSIQKPAIGDIVFDKVEEVNIEVPYVKQPSLDIEEYQKVEQKITELPLFMKPKLEVAEYAKPEKMIPKVPNIIKPAMSIVPFKWINDYNPILPDIQTVKADNQVFYTAPIISSELPRIAKPSPVITHVKPLDLLPCKVPQNILNIPDMNTMLNDFVSPVYLKPLIPDVVFKRCDANAYQSPDLHREVHLPHIMNRGLLMKPYTSINEVKADIPAVFKITKQSMGYIKPKCDMLALPVFMKPNLDAFYDIPKTIHKAVLPDLERIHWNAVSVSKITRLQPIIPFVQCPQYGIKDYKTIRLALTEIPCQTRVKAPDAAALLQEIKYLFKQKENAL